MGFGDSITVGEGSSDDGGYRDRLAAKLTQHFGMATVINQGLAGTRSNFGAGRIDASLMDHRPAYSLILYGTNDWNQNECKTAFPCFTLASLRQMVLAARFFESLPVLATIIPCNVGFDERAPRSGRILFQDERVIRPMAREEAPAGRPGRPSCGGGPGQPLRGPHPSERRRLRDHRLGVLRRDLAPGDDGGGRAGFPLGLRLRRAAARLAGSREPRGPPGPEAGPGRGRMKTGRLLKFRRPGGEIHAYLYKEEGQYRAALYLLSAERPDDSPMETLSGPVESAVEQDVRAWVDSHFPPKP